MAKTGLVFHRAYYGVLLSDSGAGVGGVNLAAKASGGSGNIAYFSGIWLGTSDANNPTTANAAMVEIMDGNNNAGYQPADWGYTPSSGTNNFRALYTIPKSTPPAPTPARSMSWMWTRPILQPPASLMTPFPSCA